MRVKWLIESACEAETSWIGEVTCRLLGADWIINPLKLNYMKKPEFETKLRRKKECKEKPKTCGVTFDSEHGFSQL